MKRNEILIEADELMSKLDDPLVRVFDTTIMFFREETDITAYEQYTQAHIPGAAFFDHAAFSDPQNKYMYMVLPEAELAAQIGQIGINQESEVILYTSGLLPCATRAWWVLRYAGHNNVRILNGGLSAWQEAGGAVAQGGHQYEATTFKGRLRPEMFVGKEAVQAALQDGQVCTVNTLPREVYDQSHITGSSLLPCQDLTENMTFLAPDEQLAARLQEEMGYKRIITYCGGGIAATLNAMAHLLVGNDNVAVYDGSMDEWAGEGLPITTQVRKS